MIVDLPAPVAPSHSQSLYRLCLKTDIRQDAQPLKIGKRNVFESHRATHRRQHNGVRSLAHFGLGVDNVKDSLRGGGCHREGRNDLTEAARARHDELRQIG